MTQYSNTETTEENFEQQKKREEDDTYLAEYKTKKTENGKILIVDDDADIIRASKYLIEHYSSYHCDSASDGFEAIDALCERCYDYVLIDINLPGMSGIAVLNALDKHLSSDPVLSSFKGFAKKIPVLLISGGDAPTQTFEHLKFFEVREFIPKSELSRRLAQNFAS